MTLYLIKDNVTVDLTPSGRVEETMVNNIFAAERGVSPRHRTRDSESTGGFFGNSTRDYNSATGTIITRYKIGDVNFVSTTEAGAASETGDNYYTPGGSFDFKTITLDPTKRTGGGGVPALVDGQTLYVNYTAVSGDTIVIDSGRVRTNYIITGNLLSNAQGNVVSKKDSLREIFNAGGNVSLTFDNDTLNIFPTRMTFVNNAAEPEQAELIIEAIRGTDKR